MDKKGNFFGQIWVNENLLAINLLQKGFAYLDVRDTDFIPELDELEKAEGLARDTKTGVWNSDTAIELGIQDAHQEEEYDEGPAKATIIQLNSTNGFYIRFDSDESKFLEVTNLLKSYEESKDIMQHPLKQSQVCVVKCEDD